MATLQTPNTAPVPVDEFRGQMTKMEGEIVKVLPRHINIAAFTRIVLTAVQLNPDLLAADRGTMFSACLNAAKDGLLPDGKQSALAVFNTNMAKKGEPPKWKKVVQYMPMVAGIRKQARQSGEVTSLTAHVVYEHDEFDYALGDDEHIDHKPVLSGRGEAIAAYAIAKLKDGEIIREVMALDEIEKIRTSSKNPDGPFWRNWWGEMARKTVIRRLSKSLPLSVDSLLSHDDAEPQPVTYQATVQRPQREALPPLVEPSMPEPLALPEAVDARDAEFPPIEPPADYAPPANDNPADKKRANGKKEKPKPVEPEPQADAETGTYDVETGEVLPAFPDESADDNPF